MKKTIKSLAILLILFLGLRTCYYGAPFRTCIYTEEDVPLNAFIKNSKVYFIKQAELIIGHDSSYGCLSEIGKITNKIDLPGNGKYQTFS